MAPPSRRETGFSPQMQSWDRSPVAELERRETPLTQGPPDCKHKGHDGPSRAIPDGLEGS